MRFSVQKSIITKSSFISGFQWFFFIFCNTVVIPPTLQSAFHLTAETTFVITQYAFLLIAVACLIQAFLGHKRSLMEGSTGLWWATILTVTLSESMQGTALATIGWSLTVGIFLSGIVTLLIGITGIGNGLSSLFKPGVLVVFMFLLGAQLVSIFLKGMLGLPFGVIDTNVEVNYPVFFLAFAVLILVIAMIVFLPASMSQYALLCGTIIGWIAYSLLFDGKISAISEVKWELFPFGRADEVQPSIVITAILAGILNTSNTFGAIRGSDVFYQQKGLTKSIYRRSFVASGVLTLFSAPLGVVPFSPFVSSIGLITQTKDTSRVSFTIGSVLLLLVGAIAALTQFFRSLPLAIGSAVMLATYLPLLFSSFSFLAEIKLNARNIYRLALPLFIGIFLMSAPDAVMSSLPMMFSSLLGNGLLMGIILSLILENSIKWDHIH
ncbi:uracil/xanthine transporter [Providencia stuartii]|uniref:uracil/xanthine transporter n=1 Tax=Providencia stuartii TaxID=588 RepID=UPI0018C485CC|nr:uracil/xanthine transporter [Providencia stuartii]MBG5921331.1 uracil/xanthine transporter [Providencia stuartii]